MKALLLIFLYFLSSPWVLAGPPGRVSPDPVIADQASAPHLENPAENTNQIEQKDQNRNISIFKKCNEDAIVPSKAADRLISNSAGILIPLVGKPTSNASITSCCSQTPVGLLPKDTPIIDPLTGKVVGVRHNSMPSHDLNIDEELSTNPYISGVQSIDQISWDFGFTSKKYFQFDKEGLSVLGKPHMIQNDIPYKIPEMNKNETEDAYYHRRLHSELSSLGIKEDMALVTTPAGSGAQSKVFYIHPPIPSPETLLAQFPNQNLAEARMFWVRQNSKSVIKLRSPAPWGKEDLARSANMAKRDQILPAIFDTLANRFRVNPTGDPHHKGERLIEAVHYKNSTDQLSRGVFIQDPVNGETAFQIAERIKRATRGSQKEKDYLINHLGFKSIDDAKVRINALENFYRETHNDVYNFLEQNKMIEVAGKTNTNALVSLGFDYHFGQNVIWDPKERIFKAFDL